MSKPVTPSKIIGFCESILSNHCQLIPKKIALKSTEAMPTRFNLEGGTSRMAMDENQINKPVVLMKNGFWIHFSVSFGPLKGMKNKLELATVTLQIFRDQSDDIISLFRAEWANEEINKYEHPQPHWHISPEVQYNLSGNSIDKVSFETYLDLVREDGFEKQLLNKSQKNDISSFHFAMSSRWPDKGDAVIELNENNLRNWLTLILENLNLQLDYCFN